MNIFFILIISILLIEYLINTLADRLTLKHLSTEVPEEFSDIFEKDAYSRSQNYTREKLQFNFITSSTQLIALFLFWFSGGFTFCNTMISSLSHNEIIRGELFIGLLVILSYLLSLPFTLYETFVIEQKYGFNKTTIQTFITDTIKTFALGTVLGVPLLAAILAFFQFTGANAWLYCWLIVTLFSLALHYIAPQWIMPLFNKFTPLADGELKQSIYTYAKKVQYPLSDIFMIDGSKRSTKSNAFFTGFGKNRRIALYDTLIEKHTTQEIVSILAHEIGHFKKKHITQLLIVGIAHSGLLFFLLSQFLTQQDLYRAFGISSMPLYAGFIFFGLLYKPIEMLASLFINYLSRKNEYEADAFAAQTVSDKETLITALKKLCRNNLSNLTPHTLTILLHHSHPPVLQRIHAIRKVPLS